MGFFEWLSSLFGSDENDYKQEQTKPKKEEPTEEKYVTEQKEYKQTLNKAVEQSKKANIPEPKIIQNINYKIKEYDNNNDKLCIGFTDSNKECNNDYKKDVDTQTNCDFREGEQEWIKNQIGNPYKSVCELAANETDFNKIQKLVNYIPKQIQKGGKSKKHKNKQKRNTQRHRKN